MRLLRGEALDAVSRESQVPAHELESWKRVFLEQGTRGPTDPRRAGERELTLARAKIGELMMRLELAEDLIEKRGFRTSGRGARDEGPGEPARQRPYLSHDLRRVSGGRARACTRRGGTPSSRQGRRAGPKTRHSEPTSSRRSAPSCRVPFHGRAIERSARAWRIVGCIWAASVSCG